MRSENLVPHSQRIDRTGASWITEKLMSMTVTGRKLISAHWVHQHVCEVGDEDHSRNLISAPLEHVF